MAPVFGEGGNLPTRFFELDREMLKREGFDFEKFAKKVRASGSRVGRDSRLDPRAGHAGHLHVASGVHESIRIVLSTSPRPRAGPASSSSACRRGRRSPVHV